MICISLVIDLVKGAVVVVAMVEVVSIVVTSLILYTLEVRVVAVCVVFSVSNSV